MILTPHDLVGPISRGLSKATGFPVKLEAVQDGDRWEVIETTRHRNGTRCTLVAGDEATVFAYLRGLSHGVFARAGAFSSSEGCWAGRYEHGSFLARR